MMGGERKIGSKDASLSLNCKSDAPNASGFADDTSSHDPSIVLSNNMLSDLTKTLLKRRDSTRFVALEQS